MSASLDLASYVADVASSSHETFDPHSARTCFRWFNKLAESCSPSQLVPLCCHITLDQQLSVVSPSLHSNRSSFLMVPPMSVMPELVVVLVMSLATPIAELLLNVLPLHSLSLPRCSTDGQAACEHSHHPALPAPSPHRLLSSRSLSRAAASLHTRLFPPSVHVECLSPS